MNKHELWVLIILSIVAILAILFVFSTDKRTTGAVSYDIPRYPYTTSDLWEHANRPDVRVSEYGENFGVFGSKVVPSQIQEPYYNRAPSRYVCCDSIAISAAGLTRCPTDPYEFQEYCTIGQSPEGPVYKYAPCSIPEIWCPVP